jgi:predicted DNA-binding transcriptional regulator
LEVTVIPSDQSLGALLLIGAVVGIGLYFWLVFFVAPLLVLQFTGFIAIAGILAIVAWIGYTMATTPPPEPLEFEEPS